MLIKTIYEVNFNRMVIFCLGIASNNYFFVELYSENLRESQKLKGMNGGERNVPGRDKLMMF